MRPHVRISKDLAFIYTHTYFCLQNTLLSFCHVRSLLLLLLLVSLRIDMYYILCVHECEIYIIVGVYSYVRIYFFLSPPFH